MNVNNIMDLGGSQSTSKTRGAQSTSKNQAASSDLFKSIIGQKQAGSQKQSGLDVQRASQQPAKPAQQTTQGGDSAVQGTSSKDTAPAAGNDSTPADNLENTAAEDVACEDAAVSEPSGEEPVKEDEVPTAEEAPKEETEEPAAEETDAPKQIFVMQMPVAAAAAPMAPVIISSETYQASAVEAIVNDVVLDEPVQPQIFVQVSEAQVSVSQNEVEVQTADFTAVLDAEAPQQVSQDAAIEVSGTLRDVAEGQQPQQQTAAKPAVTAEAAQVVPQDVEQEAPVQPAETVTEQQAVQGSTAEQPEAAAAAPEHQQRTDAADEFAVQVVREARDMVESTGTGEVTQEADLESLETEQPVMAKADADDTDDAAGKGTEQQKTTQTQQAAAPGTAVVAEDGRVDLRTNAAQPLEAEQYLQPETRQMIMNRVVDQVRSAVSPDRTEFYIQLKPDFLGGLSIGLVAEEKGIVAKIMTSSQQVHSALQADMTALQQVLRERGINVVEMDVVYNQMTDTASKDNSDNRQQQFSQGGSSRGHGRIPDQTDDGMTMYDTLSTYDVLTENGGSVEFTA